MTGDKTDENMQEPILSYANGKGQNIMYSKSTDSATGECKRNELKQDDFLSMESRAPAMIYDFDEHHGGDDVALWATGNNFISIVVCKFKRKVCSYLNIIYIYIYIYIAQYCYIFNRKFFPNTFTNLGPMSYLFHKTHEQSYVAHVIAYSMCIGPYADRPECRYHRTSNTASSTKSTTSVIIFAILLLISV